MSILAELCNQSILIGSQCVLGSSTQIISIGGGSSGSQQVTSSTGAVTLNLGNYLNFSSTASHTVNIGANITLAGGAQSINIGASLYTNGTSLTTAITSTGNSATTSNSRIYCKVPVYFSNANTATSSWTDNAGNSVTPAWTNLPLICHATKTWNFVTHVNDGLSSTTIAIKWYKCGGNITMSWVDTTEGIGSANTVRLTVDKSVMPTGDMRMPISTVNNGTLNTGSIIFDTVNNWIYFGPTATSSVWGSGTNRLLGGSVTYPCTANSFGGGNA